MYFCSLVNTNCCGGDRSRRLAGKTDSRTRDAEIRRRRQTHRRSRGDTDLPRTARQRYSRTVHRYGVAILVLDRNIFLRIVEYDLIVAGCDDRDTILAVVEQDLHAASGGK